MDVESESESECVNVNKEIRNKARNESDSFVFINLAYSDLSSQLYASSTTATA